MTDAQNWVPSSPLTIQAIETEALRIPLNKVYRGSKYSMQNRCTIITRILTKQGVVGEVYTGDTDEEQDVILSIIHKELAPVLIGMDVFNTEGCWEAMKPATYDILRDRGVVMQAISAVDTAIWDTVGKALNMPMYRLWGGYTNRLPMIAIGGYYGQNFDELAHEVSSYIDYGVVGMKFKIGGATPEEDLERLKIARQVGGEKFTLMVDANQGYDLQQAIRFCRLAENAGIELYWFEEPVRWYNDKRWLRDVRLSTGVPITAGQSEYRIDGVRDLIIGDSIDYCNFDTSWGGGPTMWRRVASICSAFGIKMAHHEEAQISAHLLGSVAHGTFVECFHRDRDPFFWDIQTEARPLKDGYYTISDKPGFGIELDRAYVAKYKVR
ncbi:MAG: mandelate racemase/muconate lactonizing enzyme family protein [Chloroflexi bacterium]|nr:mandelate racemase/muconate lactonizing enzyme family protein [Chloroflexota bacterium]MCC6891671.1 mandelate racemase/muconate lactonizing enzyme family protein [Anaerolineae bacterium]